MGEILTNVSMRCDGGSVAWCEALGCKEWLDGGSVGRLRTRKKDKERPVGEILADDTSVCNEWLDGGSVSRHSTRKNDEMYPKRHKWGRSSGTGIRKPGCYLDTFVREQSTDSQLSGKTSGSNDSGRAPRLCTQPSNVEDFNASFILGNMVGGESQSKTIIYSRRSGTNAHSTARGQFTNRRNTPNTAIHDRLFNVDTTSTRFYDYKSSNSDDVPTGATDERHVVASSSRYCGHDGVSGYHSARWEGGSEDWPLLPVYTKNRSNFIVGRNDFDDEQIRNLFAVRRNVKHRNTRCFAGRELLAGTAQCEKGRTDSYGGEQHSYRDDSYFQQTCFRSDAVQVPECGAITKSRRGATIKCPGKHHAKRTDKSPPTTLASSHIYSTIPLFKTVAECVDYGLPIFVRSLVQVNIEVVKSYLQEQDRNMFTRAYTLFSENSPLHVCEDDLGVSSTRAAKLSADDITALLGAHLIVPIQRCEVRGKVYCFSVNERHKERRRWVVWSKAVNNLFESQLPMPLKSAAEVTSESYRRFAATLDVASCFHHFPLHLSVRKFFCFDWGGGCYCITTIPTGARDPPSIAQIVTSSLRYNISSTSVVTVHIDNVRILNDCKDTLMTDVSTMLSNAQRLGIILNVCSISDSYDFLGVHYLHRNDGTVVTIAEKTRQKILAAELNNAISMRCFIGTFSRLVFCSWVLRLPLHRYYIIYKFLRRRAQQNCVLDEPANVWHSLWPALGAWISEVVSSAPVVVRPTPLQHLTPTIITDASEVGWGAIAYTTHGVFAAAGPFACELPICELEFKALLNGIDALRQHLGDEVNILVDNSTVMHAVRNRRSS